MPFREATARLRALLQRKDRVLTVMHTPSAGLARAMEAAGAEAAFVGTAGVVGAYTGMEDVGVASIPECVTIGGWIARAVDFPVILDGVIGPMELGHLPYKKGKTFEEYVGSAGMRRLGKKKWHEAVFDVVARLKHALQAEYVVLGGGNTKKLDELPPGAAPATVKA